MPRSTVPSLSGALYLRNEKVFRQVLGDKVVDQALASLTKEEQDILESAVPAAWIPVCVVDGCYEAIARCAGRELKSFYPQVVRLGVSQTLRSVWKVLIRLTTDRALLSRASVRWGAQGHDPRTRQRDRRALWMAGCP